MTMNKNLEKVLTAADTAVLEAIASSQKNHKTLQFGACNAIFVAAHMDIANVDKLNKLINGVTNSDYEMIRLFFVRVIQKFGPVKDNGKPHSFLTYKSAEKTFSLNNTGTDENKAMTITMRKAVQAAGVEGLMSLPFKGIDRETLDRKFDAIGTVHGVIKRLAAHGETVLAKSINSVLGDGKMTTDAIEKIVKANDPRQKIADAEKQIAEWKKQAEKLDSNKSDEKEEKPEAEKQAA